MRSIKVLLCSVLLVASCSRQSTPANDSSVLFEGARLIVGDGTVIDDSAFLMENNKISKVGKKGEVQAPNATRVDLSGKTVMPAIVDAHSHLGHAIIKTGQIGKDTYTKDNLIDHLQRYAYYGIAATQSMGIDRGEIPYQVRADPPPNAALFHTAGRGMALPGMGPGADYWRDAAYGVTTEDEARKDVQELAAKNVDLIKIWVDDRGGTVKKLPPALYRAIIDEAHKHNLRVAAHIFALEDAKELLRSNIDVFAHGIRDKDADDEVMKLFKEHPNVIVIPNLPERPTPTIEDAAWLGETLPAPEIQKLRDAIANRKPEAEKKAKDFFDLQARNMMKLYAAGVKLAFGTDSGVSVGWPAHVKLADMVVAGLTPAQTIEIATKNSAEAMKLDQLGTLAAGKSADFIVLDANPLENITNTRKIAKVYLRGKEVDRAALRAKFTN